MKIKCLLLLIVLIPVGMFFSGCGQKKILKKEVDSSTNDITLTIPDMEMFDFSFKYTENGKLLWKLLSDRAEIFNKEKMKNLDKVKLTMYKNNRIDSRVVSKFGKHDEDKNILTAITNVVLTTEDNSKLYTQLLHWDQQKELLYTDLYVKIVKPNGDIIRGVGLRADSSLEKIKILNSVTGEFYEEN